MTDDQIKMALALGKCSFFPGSSQKRFARNMAHWAQLKPQAPITGAQDRYLRDLVQRFRRQLPDHIVSLAGVAVVS